ncbi:MAG: T9SS type A sorting domain-containing protein [Flavobacteriales bacterium]|nr:T9SS type A sorting domain-containing protein [Flavobacteriales bacterium]
MKTTNSQWFRPIRWARRIGSALALTLLAVSAAEAQTYCASDGGSGNTFNIARVQFNGIDNASGDNNGYGNFTSLVSNVDPGASYGITLNPNGPFFLRYRWRTWVDWNNDGTFSGAELVFQTTGFGQESGTVSVPAGTTPGAKRMRVNMSAFTYQGACANYAVGEVEDYTVLVSAPCDVTAGSLQIVKPVICYEGGPAGVSANVVVAPTAPAGYEILYVLTQGSGLVIIDAAPNPSFSLPGIGGYTIHTLVYDPTTLDLGIVEFGVTTGFQVNSLLVQGGGTICAALDVAGAQAFVIDPQAGTLSGGGEACGPLPVTLTATPNGDANLPSGYQTLYVLTQGTDLVIQNVSASPSFEVNEEGLFTIHTLVYDPNTLDLSGVVVGTTTGFDVNGFLVQGGGSICASLDVAGAAFNVADPNAGTLSGGGDVCLSGDAVTLTATPNGDSNTPDGYSLAYVLTSGTNLVIEQLGASPEFTVTAGGLYTIHTFVFPSSLDLSVVVPGTTTGGDVLALLAANNICASLDVAGAAFNVADPNAGTLSGGGDVCLSGDAVTLTATPNGDSNTPDGYSLAYVLTSGTNLAIEQLGATPSFEVTSGGLYTIHTFVFPSGLDLSVVVPGTTTGGDVLALLAANNICASLDVAGAAFNVADPNAGTLSGGGDVCLSGDAVTLTATPNGDSNTPAGYSLAYVLTSGANLVIEQLGASPEFTVTAGGLYTIHTFVFPSSLDLSVVVPGTTTGGDVLALLAANNICASLDVAGAAFNVADPNAGTLSGGGDVCLSGDAVTLTATPNGDSNTPAGYSLAYVLTSGANLVIEQLGASPEFTVTAGGLYTIHTFVFPSSLDLSVVVPGTTTGGDVLALLAANNICASLDVAGAAFNVADPNAGTLSGGGDVCLSGDAVTLTATPNGDSNTPDGYSLAYVLTSGTNLVIEQLGATPSFEVTSGGLYTIHTFVFPSSLDLSVVVPGTTTGGDVLALLAANNICASLDVAGAAFNVADPNAGTLSGGGDVCLSGDAVTLTATPNGDSNTPDGYSLAYVLTSGTNLVIEQLGATPSFEVTSGGLYTIHTFVFPSGLDLSVVVPGTTTGGDVLALLAANNICASLDVAGAAFNVADPNAGTLSGGGDVCLSGDAVTLTATPNGDSNTPDGYSLAYVLTSGTSLVIEQLGGTPSFEVTAGGLYTIHTFVFPSDLDLSVVVPGTTTGGDVLALLAANNICASLDVAGAAFNVADPNAGTLSGGGDVCLSGDAVTLTATPNGDSNTPDGYSLAYVLTSGTNLVIEQLGASPEFTVTAGGLYTIHTFVFPSSLDLSVVVPGTTTGGDVLALLAANNICASLDVAGAAFNVADPNAGTLSGGGDVCLSGDAVTLTATPNGDSNTPDGYSLAYVLTSGTNLVIEQLGASPEFTVTAGGLYTIHTFVFPSDLDLSVVVPGTTTGGDVLALLAANNICASLDVAGAAFNVADPNAGTLSGGGDVCLSGDAVTLTATPNGDSNTPDGYSLAYVLTSGTNLVIEQLGASPEFTVTAGGLYTIHTFVFPSDLDLSVVVPGTTTGGDVLAPLAANNICASLDVAGAAFNVTTCETECAASAGTITPADFLVCWQDEQLIGIPAGNAVVPVGYEVLYVLTRGNGLVIRQVNTVPEFTVNQNGVYRIHTLVYDPATLDLSIVQIGTTTGFDVNSLLIQGGGSICASLDVDGAPFIAVGPIICGFLDLFRGIDQSNPEETLAALENMDPGMAMAIENDSPVNITAAWPNPTRDVLNLSIYVVGDRNVAVSVVDLMGKEMQLPQAFNYGTGYNQVSLDVSMLSAGAYMVRILSADKVVSERFVKMD